MWCKCPYFNHGQLNVINIYTKFEDKLKVLQDTKVGLSYEILSWENDALTNWKRRPKLVFLEVSDVACVRSCRKNACNIIILLLNKEYVHKIRMFTALYWYYNIDDINDINIIYLDTTSGIRRRSVPAVYVCMTATVNRELRQRTGEGKKTVTRYFKGIIILLFMYTHITVRDDCIARRAYAISCTPRICCMYTRGAK